MAFDGVLKFSTAIDKAGFKTGVESLGGIAKKGMDTVGKTIGSAVSTGMKVATAAIASGTAAVAALGKQALDAYADFEQLSGGVETFFGDAAQTVMDNAAKAFETAGMSANDYMETATSSAAAMVNSLAGDTKKAAELTDMAITDMADNINKMGSAAESVQNAYAGFAKGNFTMLDNLKLGYGGTKEEMERLLADAQKLTGIQYDISSYSDIVQAIHAIQVEMGITGTTAKEASETISGSTAAMKAAWENLLVGVADDTQDFDKLADDFVGSVETAAQNILPRVETIGDGVVKLIGALGDDAVELLVQALSSAPDLVGTGVQLVSTLVDGVVTGLPRLLPAGKELLLTLANGVINGTPALLDAANGITDGIASMVGDPQIAKYLQRAGRVLLKALAEGLTRNLPILTEAGLTVAQGLIELLMQPDLFSELLQLGVEILGMLGTGLIENLPVLLDAALQIILMLVQMLTENVDSLVEAAITLITTLSTFLIEHAPELLTAAIQIIEILMQSLGDNAGELVSAAILIVSIIGQFLVEHAPELTTAALELLLAIVEGLSENSDELLLAVEEIIKALWDALSDPENQKMLIDAGFTLLVAILNGARKFGGELLGFAYDLFDASWDTLTTMDWGELGKNLLLGIIKGMRNSDLGALNGIKDRLLDGVQDVFEIESPSKVMRDQVGKYLAQGIGVGFTEELPDVGEDALAAFTQLEASVNADRYTQPQSYSYITNNYGGDSFVTNRTESAPQPQSERGGDIIIPVTIGDSQLDTVVVRAAQIANARSGGVTL